MAEAVGSPGSPALDRDAALAYWDRRHAERDALRSGGHIGLDVAANEIFYAVRLGRLLELIGDRTSRTEPLAVLDAGCGKGYFARGVARCGFLVDAIDASATAVAACRAAGPPSVRYARSTLAGWDAPSLYDVVYSVDVLFHILDDDEWAASLRNLASLVRFGGRLILTDERIPARRPRGNYIVHRAESDYGQLLEPRGFTLADFTPYAFRDNEIGFFTFLRNR